MTKPDDGGPAFPLGHKVEDADTVVHHLSFGMSLRDWFATFAPIELGLGEMLTNTERRREYMRERARLRWGWADAMLVEREKEAGDASA